eukprot:2759301-Prymnesium_polylepis.1
MRRLPQEDHHLLSCVEPPAGREYQATPLHSSPTASDGEFCGTATTPLSAKSHQNSPVAGLANHNSGGWEHTDFRLGPVSRLGHEEAGLVDFGVTELELVCPPWEGRGCEGVV